MDNMSSLLVLSILSAGEGLTEFLPVSSTGHMILIGHLIKFEGKKAKFFEIIIQLGPVLAVIKIFWKRLLGLIAICFKFLLKQKGEQVRTFTLIHVFLGIIPSMIMGLMLYDTIQSLFNPISVMYALIFGSLFLVIAEYLKPRSPCVLKAVDMTYGQAFIIGCSQCLALWPGFSRSAATISAGILIGVSRYVASEFSFFLSVPMMLGTTAFELYKNINFLTIDDLSIVSVSVLISFFTALIVVNSFLRLVKRISLIPFAIYRFAVVVIFYLFFF